MSVDDLLREVKIRHPGYVFVELYASGSLSVYDYSFEQMHSVPLMRYGHYSDLVSGMNSAEEEPEEDLYGQG